MSENKLDIKFQKDFLITKRKLQLKISFTLLSTAIIITILSFIGEISYYTKIWGAKELKLYSICFVIYELFLLTALYLIRKERLRLPYPDIKKSKRLILLITYVITAVMFCIVFIGRFYDKEIFFLSIINIIFGIVFLLNNKERAIFLITNFIFYCIGSYLVLSDSLSFFPDIGKAFSVYLVTFIAGRVTYGIYKQLLYKSYKLNEVVINQKETLGFLADELNLNNYYNEVDDNLEELNQAIRTLLIEFSDSKKQLATALVLANEASMAKEMFLANISHEIRTPLHAIIGLIRELKKEELNKKQMDYTRGAGNAAEHLLSIVNNVLDISKIESGELILTKENFSFCATIDNMVSIFKSDIHKNGLIIDYQKDQNIHDVFIGDSKVIRQIIFNIVGNAIKFTNTGKISLITKLIADEQDFQTLEIIVKDTGIGMSENFLNKIFDKFTQEDNTINSSTGGTGLGMSITKKLVSLLNGELNIDSKLNHGTSVSIKFKIKKGMLEDLINIKFNKKENVLFDKSILLVDDNKMNRLIARKSLESLKCKVIEAENGQEAIDNLKDTTFDLIFMDIQMPILNGVEATKIIRNDLKIETPIIALTANAFKKDIDSYLKIGINDYLIKPFDENNLLRSLINNIGNKDKLYSLNAFEKYDDINFMKKYLKSFHEEIDLNINKLTKSIEEKDIEKLNFILHKIKPNIEFLAITKVQKDIDLLEDNENLKWTKFNTEKSQNIINNLILVQKELELLSK